MKRTQKGKKTRGEETGAIRKEWGGKIPVALVYPNFYRAGISSLGFQIIYQILNQYEDVVCERFFLPENDPARNRIRSRESGRLLSDFELIAVSLPYENDYLGFRQILKGAALPFLSRERSDAYPLLLGGGLALTLNPEPLAEVLDLAVVGEGEATLRKILEVYRQVRGAGRAEVLKSLAGIGGVYVPRGYMSSPGGYEPLPGFPARVRRQSVSPLAEYPGHSSILTRQMEFGRSVLIEPIRGCGRMCRFCAAGYHYLPPRSRPVGRISGLDLARREQAQVGLLGAALVDYPEFSDLLDRINRDQLRVTLSSLHGEELNEDDLARLSRAQVRTLTLAPESGSEGLRLSLNKTSTDCQYREAARKMVATGIPHLRLYFLYGLPGETTADLRAIGDFAEQIQRERRKESRKVPGRLTVCLAPFVPKPATPFQWAVMESARDLKKKRDEIIRSLRPVSQVLVRTESVIQARLEAFFGRADRRMGEILEGRPFPEIRRWALEDEVPWLQPPPDPGASFPWDIVDSGVTRGFLWREWENARLGLSSFSCRPRPEPAAGEGRGTGCARCGVCPLPAGGRDEM